MRHRRRSEARRKCGRGVCAGGPAGEGTPAVGERLATAVLADATAAIAAVVGVIRTVADRVAVANTGASCSDVHR